MAETKSYPIIGKEDKFYGYVVGLFLEKGHHAQRMFVKFEYGDARETWEIPDYDLFKMLSDYLVQNAFTKREFPDEGMYGKVWIGFKDGEWSVDLP